MKPPPILVHRDEIIRLYKITQENPELRYVALAEYESTFRKVVPPEAMKHMEALLNGTHPMLNRDLIAHRLEQIKAECRELGIEYEKRPMHEVLIELNCKRAEKLMPDPEARRY